MTKSSSKGYILLESLIGLGVLTTAVFLFLTVQTQILQQSAQLQAKVAALRVLYEEVQGHTFEEEIVYSTQRTETYQVSLGLDRGHTYGRITKGSLVLEITYEE
ncbi:competence type IV pilus minor pilin ComGE [Enterococcus sp.]|jgi:type II secretory pathway pseudopilin PulG|uniref:competence type IV pilus minor pilin ComGE n=1 Tax=Enterococcus sp. TaxID=35783 RepID=UPI0025C1ABF8|nr:competence type IV pilus minor pilin ComGE [Enterococcus sp.]